MDGRREYEDIGHCRKILDLYISIYVYIIIQDLPHIEHIVHNAANHIIPTA